MLYIQLMTTKAVHAPIPPHAPPARNDGAGRPLRDTRIQLRAIYVV